MVSATATAVFDFKDNENPPSVRLAVFFQLANEAQRTESFTVSNDETCYIWHVSKPGIFTGLNKNYAYSVNLNAPEGEALPSGAYKVIYHDAAGNEDEARFSVAYNKELLSSNTESFRQYLTNSNENIALYDDSGELLYMGKAKSSWKNNAAILKDYKLCDVKRVCYVTPGNSIVCMLPAEKMKEKYE